MRGWDIRLEPRGHQASPWLGLAVPVVAVAAALVVGAVFLAIEGFSPVDAYSKLVQSSFTTLYGITDTLAVATPLILTGLAAAVAMRVNLYNIGGEGQLYIGAITASGTALALGDSLPAGLAVPIVLAAGAAGGALWILVPAWTRAQRGASEIITTLLMVYVALFLMRYLIFGSHSHWRDAESSTFPQGRRLPESSLFTEFGSTRTTWALAVAVGCVVVVWFIQRSTRVGFDMSVVAGSEHAAAYAGIPVRRLVMFTMLLSGALAGLAGGVEVTARAHALDPSGLELGLGYTGIVLAALARTNPGGVLVAAVLVGGLENSAVNLQSQGIPASISQMLEGAVLLCAIGGEVLRRNRLVIRRAPAVHGEVAA